MQFKADLLAKQNCGFKTIAVQTNVLNILALIYL